MNLYQIEYEVRSGANGALESKRVACVEADSAEDVAFLFRFNMRRGLGFFFLNSIEPVGEWVWTSDHTGTRGQRRLVDSWRNVVKRHPLHPR